MQGSGPGRNSSPEEEARDVMPLGLRKSTLLPQKRKTETSFGMRGSLKRRRKRRLKLQPRRGCRIPKA